MATVILIVFIAVVAILGGWWLKRERENQKKDLIRQGKLAAGKFDEVVMPKKKPKKRKRKKREGNFWDPKYVPPEVPSRTQLDAWLVRAAKVVDELMPHVLAYRAGKSKNDPAQQTLKSAEAQLVTYYREAVTDAEAQEWFATLEGKLRAYYDARAAAQESERELRRLYTPAKDRAFELRSLVFQANDWELYKAPEPFHEKLEIVTLLFEHLKRELDLDNAQPSQFRDKSNRQFASNPNARDDRSNGTDANNPFSWQNNGPGKRKSWDNWRTNPEPEPVEDTAIAGHARQFLENSLSKVAALAAAIYDASTSQKAYFDAGKTITLTRPAKPTEQDVETVLAEATAWAKAYQAAKVKAYNDGVKVTGCVEIANTAVAALQKAVKELNDAVIPEQDRFAKDAISRACEALVSYLKLAPESVKAVMQMGAPYSLNKEEAQSDRDAASNLRNLMRKAAYALAQSEVAKANYEAAKGEHVSLAETVPPVLTQSSASAFINAHARMNEISARNAQRTEAHNAKVAQLSTQKSEREQQAIQAVRAVNTAVSGLGSKRQDWSAGLELMQSTATLFNGSFHK